MESVIRKYRTTENAFIYIIVYMNTFEEELIGLDEMISKLRKNKEEMEVVDQEIEKYCKEIGIKPIIF
ncbi:MAG: hypothetical protein LBT66_02500 [Methanobrevibacter sp.]|nr:hypothetical protein [Candidatus Methanovirga meridionalis]